MTAIIKASNTSGLTFTSDTSGNVVIQSNGTNAITTAGANVTIAGTVTATGGVTGGAITSGTAVASTSGTSIDFTGIPSWVKRITVMLNGVSTNGSGQFLIQIGPSGGVETSSYSSTSIYTGSATGQTSSTNGFAVVNGSSSNIMSGMIIIAKVSDNIWTQTHSISNNGGTIAVVGSGIKSIASTLSVLRITTTTGTDTFDAGTINILYE